MQVLHKFLTVFSEFDWDNLCLSLQGPIPVEHLHADPISGTMRMIIVSMHDPASHACCQQLHCWGIITQFCGTILGANFCITLCNSSCIRAAQLHFVMLLQARACILY